MIHIIEQTDANMITLDQIMATHPKSKIFVFSTGVKIGNDPERTYQTFVVEDA